MRFITKSWGWMKKFWSDKRGQGMVEYGLILALIAAVVIGILVTLGDDIAAWFQYIVDQIGSPPAT